MNRQKLDISDIYSNISKLHSKMEDKTQTEKDDFYDRVCYGGQLTEDEIRMFEDG